MDTTDNEPGLYCCINPHCEHDQNGLFNGGAWNGDPPRQPHNPPPHRYACNCCAYKHLEGGLVLKKRAHCRA
jgi:hypothetical protein